VAVGEEFPVKKCCRAGYGAPKRPARLGIGLHRWLVRYANEGLEALAERSSRPDRCPHLELTEMVYALGLRPEGGTDPCRVSGCLTFRRHLSLTRFPLILDSGFEDL